MRHKHNRGQTTILLVLALVPLLGMAGLAVDVGRMYTERRHAQAAADLAASAGAQEVSRSGAHAAFTDVATTYANRNGFTTASGDTLTFNNPPTSGPYVGDTNAYEVIVRRPVSTTLLRTFGKNTSTVEGRAVAVVKKSGIGIVVLDPSKGDAFRMNKKSAITLKYGTYVVNSKDKNALHVQDESSLKVGSPGKVVGGYKVDGKAKLTPPPDTGAAAIPDPLAGLTKPPCAGYSAGGGNGTSNHMQLLDIKKKTQTLCPGIYWGGLKVEQKSKVTLDDCGEAADHRVFVFVQGGFSVQDSDVVADGVTIYNTVGNFCGGDKGATDCHEMQWDDKSTVDMTAPTAGPWEGLAVWQDSGCNKKFNLAGSAFSGITGEIYMPNAQLQINGKKGKIKTSNGFLQASIVVKKLTIGNFVGTDDPSEVDGDADTAATGDPDFDLSATVGASARRVLLAE